MNDSINVTEGGHRLRAIVRVLLSSGVWAVIGMQLGLTLLWHYALSDNRDPASSSLLLLAIVLAGFLYLTAGVSGALADRREVVGLRDALRAGALYYAKFLWLIAKLVLLTGALLNVMIYLTGTSEDPSRGTAAPMFGILPLVQGILSFVFVYWLPIVFTRGDFALFKTLRAALVMAWHRASNAGFLAFLTVTPAAVSFAVDDSIPLAAVLAINLVGGAMEWVAYAYCVGCLQDRPEG